MIEKIKNRKSNIMIWATVLSLILPGLTGLILGLLNIFSPAEQKADISYATIMAVSERLSRDLRESHEKLLIQIEKSKGEAIVNSNGYANDRMNKLEELTATFLFGVMLLFG